MMGFQVGSQHVTVVDDPTLAGSYGYYEFDDEGVKAGERVLIDRGKISGLLHNGVTAAEFETESNEESRADGFARVPIITMDETCVNMGEHKYELMTAAIS